MSSYASWHFPGSNAQSPCEKCYWARNKATSCLKEHNQFDALLSRKVALARKRALVPLVRKDDFENVQLFRLLILFLFRMLTRTPIPSRRTWIDAARCYPQTMPETRRHCDIHIGVNSSGFGLLEHDTTVHTAVHAARVISSTKRHSYCVLFIRTSRCRRRFRSGHQNERHGSIHR